ncbi:MAG TPA: mechanosensitive ion channel domain-containing protein [Verrucomicrobiae bacterium]|nr:mechanosensitive ion channel domain-containing protein [Verrucomicrobiae bacterium]
MNGWLHDVAESFPQTWRPVAALIFVAAGVLIGRLFGYLLSRYAQRVGARVGAPPAKERLLRVRRWSFLTILAWGAHEAFQILVLPVRLERALLPLSFGFGVLAAALLVRQLLVLALAWYAAEVATRTHQPVDTQFIPLMRKLATVFIFATASVITLKGYGYDISALVVSLGVGSLAIGLGMQQTVANMIAGFTIMLDRPFKIGDRVTLSSGEVGDVLEIGLRSTRVLALDHTTVIMPNSQMVNDRIVNHAYPGAGFRPILRFGVAYGSDPPKVKRAIAEVLESVPLVERKPPPSIAFTGFGETSMGIAVRFTVASYRDDSLAVDAVVAGIARRFEEEGIVIPAAVHVVAAGGGAGGADRTPGG